MLAEAVGERALNDIHVSVPLVPGHPQVQDVLWTLDEVLILGLARSWMVAIVVTAMPTATDVQVAAGAAAKSSAKGETTAHVPKAALDHSVQVP